MQVGALRIPKDKVEGRVVTFLVKNDDSRINLPYTYARKV